jgi:peroxiredoxin
METFNMKVLGVLLFLLMAGFGKCDQVTDGRLATFQKFVNGEVPIKEAVVYRELSKTNGTVFNREWWRFGYQNDTWFVQRLNQDGTNSSELTPIDSTVCGASLAEFWVVSDKTLYSAAKEVATGSLPDTFGSLDRSLMFEALSLGLPRELNGLGIANAHVKWDGSKFNTIVGSKRDKNGKVIATAPLKGHLKLGDNGLPASAEYPGVDQFSGGSVTYGFTPDTLGIPKSFTEKYPDMTVRCEFLSLSLGSNDLATANGYQPSFFADMKIKRGMYVYTNALGYEQRDGKSYPAFQPPAPKLGAPPPELHGTTWLNVASPITLKSLHGQVVLLDFWAAQCSPCVEAMPHTEALYDKFKEQGLVVIGVCVNWGSEKAARRIIKDRKISFPNMMDIDLAIADQQDGSTSRSYVLVDGSPTYALIDRAGNLVWKSTGGVSPTESQITDLLKAEPSK